MTSLVSFASPLMDATRRAALEARLAPHLGDHFEILPSSGEGAPPETGPALCLVLTGGTERDIVTRLGDGDGAALLFAHPHDNSLPAALEVAAWLARQGRHGEILMVDGSPKSSAELESLRHVLATHEALHGARLGLVGGPSSWLLASTVTAAVVKDSWGVEVVEVAMAELLATMEAVGAAAIEEHAARARGQATHCGPSGEALSEAARVEAALELLVARHGLEAVTVRCFDLLEASGTTGCLALSSLLDAGVVAGCEGDVPATLTMLLLDRLSGLPPFMANPQAWDREAGTLTLAHCTVPRRLTSTHGLATHFESGRGVAIEGTLPTGPVTIARIGGSTLGEIVAVEGMIVEAPPVADRCRTQVTVRIDGGPDLLLERPLGNHHVLVPGRHAKALARYHRLFVAPHVSR